MEITAGMVKELREKTGLGMMDCKKALVDASGDMDLAIENLRKKGQATAEKRAGKNASEGAVSAIIEGSTAIIYQVNCETDFVANGNDFQGFVGKLDKVLIANKVATVDEAKKLTTEDGEPVETAAVNLTGKVGEKIDFRSYSIISCSPTEAVYSYVHSNKKVGALIQIAAADASVLTNDAVVSLGKDLAMQIAASAPRAVSESEIDPTLLAKEKEIYLEQLKNEGKPAEMAEKIVVGKVAKFLKDNTLLGQEFIKADKVTVEKHLEAVSKEVGSSLSIVSMVRVELGA